MKELMYYAVIYFLCTLRPVMPEGNLRRHCIPLLHIPKLIMSNVSLSIAQSYVLEYHLFPLCLKTCHTLS